MAGTTETVTLQLVALSDQFNRSLKQSDGNLLGLAKTLGVVSVAAAGMYAAFSAARGIDSAIGTAIDFESRLSKVRKTTGLTGLGLDELKQKLGNLATTFGGFKLGDLLDVAAMGGRLGIEGGKIAQFARDIGMITVALDDIPAEEAATKIQRILNVFKLGSENAINFASALNKLDDTSTATGRDILDITQRIAGSAQVLGVAPQKVLALATAMKEAGVQNEVAGTAITQIFGKMATQTEKFAAVAGVSVGQFTKILKADAVSALILFEKGLGKLDELGQFQALASLGLRGSRVTQTLLQLNTVLGRLPGFARTAEAEWKSLASILRENEIAGNTTAGQIERLKSALQLLAVQVGDAALPVVKSLAGSFVELTKNAKDFLRQHEGTITAISEGFTKAGRTLGLFVANFRTFVELGKQFGLEKFQQLVTVFDRLWTQVGDNLSVAFGNSFTYIRNGLLGLGQFAASFFDQMGGVAAGRFAKAFIDPLPQKLVDGLKAFLPAAVGDALDALRKMPIPALNPDVRGFAPAAMNRGMVALPGVRNPLGNLPVNPAVAPLLAQLAAARKAADDQADAAKKALLPVGNPPPANPFLKMKPAQRVAAGRKLRRAALAAGRKPKPAPKPRLPGVRGALAGAAPGAVAFAPGAKAPAAVRDARQAEIARQRALLTAANDAASKAAEERKARLVANPPRPPVELTPRQAAAKAAQDRIVAEAEQRAAARRGAAQRQRQGQGAPAAAVGPEAMLGPMQGLQQGQAGTQRAVAGLQQVVTALATKVNANLRGNAQLDRGNTVAMNQVAARVQPFQPSALQWGLG